MRIPEKFIVIFFVTLLLSTTGISAEERAKRIIGGRATDNKSWPWMASLVSKRVGTTHSLHFCGASLIAKDWILTAAHCVINADSTDFDVIINQALQSANNGERHSVAQIIVHPLYDDFLLTNDLALIKLSSPTQITPINVLAPFSTQDRPGKPAIALGWGAVAIFPLQLSFALQQVTLPLVDNPRCSARMSGVTDDMLCAGDGLGGKDTCFGDSGGPLIVFDNESNTWRQIGITSWGIECAKVGFFGVYTRLKQYALFISDHICTPQEIPEAVTLSIDIDGLTVKTSWNTLNDVSGYRLNYAPYPEAEPPLSFDVNQNSSFSIPLDHGNAYYVAVSSYKGNCLSEYSNIEYFIQ